MNIQFQLVKRHVLWGMTHPATMGGKEGFQHAAAYAKGREKGRLVKSVRICYDNARNVEWRVWFSTRAFSTFFASLEGTMWITDQSKHCIIYRNGRLNAP